MIVRINGVVIPERSIELSPEVIREVYTKKDIKMLKKLNIWLWSVAGTMMAQSPAFAATGGGSGNLWIEMKPIFGLFQEIGMVLGAFAIIGGLIVMIFKKRVATKIIGTAAIAVGGVFLVPSAIMLLAIVGSMLNDALTAVFSGLDIGGSVQVSK
ncbi:hypothetical protein [Microcystis phage MaeS]|nr:hypothetical protein [Microcystis phage MaeS]